MGNMLPFKSQRSQFFCLCFHADRLTEGIQHPQLSQEDLNMKICLAFMSGVDSQAKRRIYFESTSNRQTKIAEKTLHKINKNK